MFWFFSFLPWRRYVQNDFRGDAFQKAGDGSHAVAAAEAVLRLDSSQTAVKMLPPGT
jgi:hypothetical protein